MATQNNAQKVNYREVLTQRTEAIFEQCCQGKTPEKCKRAILEDLRETGLESGKNGIQAGKRAAHRKQTVKKPA